MADQHVHVNNVNLRQVERHPLIASPQKLRQYILSRKEPVVFDGAVSSWKCMGWTPEFLAAELGDLRTRFRLCVRETASGKTTARNYSAAVMETDCDYEEATFGEFSEWLNGCVKTSGRLSRFERSEYWCYADYKYMAELLKDFPHLRQSVDWSCFGFPGRSGDNSTIWIGSAEASTPCHVDTYGCNLVAQIYGTKKWTLFPPSENERLYPTRIPYEESSVFSQVNISNPNLEEFTDFVDAVRCEVVLKPGDVLFVPKQWWHFVESLETSISINTWIELESDHVERVKEAVIRTLVCALKRDEGCDERTWVNPSEDIGTHMQNMDYLQQALAVVTQRTACSDVSQSENDSCEERKGSSLQNSMDEKQHRCNKDSQISRTLSTNDFVNCILTAPEVISTITNQVFKKLRISQTLNNSPLESDNSYELKLQDRRGEPSCTLCNNSNCSCCRNCCRAGCQGIGCTGVCLEDSAKSGIECSGGALLFDSCSSPCKKRCVARDQVN